MLKGERPSIFGDGTATRDYVYVDDVVEANMLALDKGDRDFYNIATSEEASVNEIFHLLKSETDFTKDPIYKPERPGEVYKIYLTNNKAKSGLGWTPKVAMQEGIRKTVEYYRA
jgi:UDP-glucose 4-epimerase